MGTAYPLTLPALLDHAGRWFSTNDAVVDATFQLTYEELSARARQSATLFAELGAERGEPVAIISPPCAHYFVAFFGAVYLGALPVALHTRDSPQTMAAVCRKIGARLLVYDANYEEQAAAVLELLEGRINAVRVRPSTPLVSSVTATAKAVIPDDLFRFAPIEARPQVAEDDPGCLVLSSGTTSIPKGVIHSHRGMVELARSGLYMYGGVRPSDRALVMLSTAFIGCYNSWLPFLNAGGCCVCQEKFDIENCVRLVARHRVTHIVLTPTIWRKILNGSFEPSAFQSLRAVGVGAEVLDGPTLERLRSNINPNVFQVYGSTEAGVAATCITAEEMTGERFTSVGRPMINTEIRVVTPSGGPTDEVERGELGEILLSSPTLAAGVWRSPELTAEGFLQDGERRWWRSRDLGRLDAGGFLYIEGRSDDMIISGGINIHPARVEEVLLQHQRIKECAVIGIPDPEWGQQVQAFVVTKDGALSGEELDKFVRASELSGFQRPRAYFFLSELPRTATEKLNRRVLRDRFQEFVSLAGSKAEASPAAKSKSA